jgi:hypothetical protein
MQVKDDTADNDYQQQQQCAQCNSTYCICNYDASDDNKHDGEYESDENEYDDDDYDNNAHNNAPAKAITGIWSHVEHL